MKGQKIVGNITFILKDENNFINNKIVNMFSFIKFDQYDDILLSVTYNESMIDRVYLYPCNKNIYEPHTLKLTHYNGSF